MLLVLAISDGALFGFRSLDDLRKLEIPPGQDELILRFKDDALDRFVFRRWTLANGITEEKMPKSAFWDMFRRTMRKAGYLCGTAMHSIRQQLGKRSTVGFPRPNTAPHRLSRCPHGSAGPSHVAMG